VNVVQSLRGFKPKVLNIKICGMRDEQNVWDVLALAPEALGFIFYERSPRYAGATPPALVRALRAHTATVGVFVDAPEVEVLRRVEEYGLCAVQLHGSEPPELCERAAAHTGAMVIKVFSLWSNATNNDMQSLETNVRRYYGAADCVLFDTKSASAHGGTGTRFDWRVLEHYGQTSVQTSVQNGVQSIASPPHVGNADNANNVLPFVLSGGIAAEHAEELRALHHHALVGLDLNSRFETAPGVKDVERLRTFVARIRS